jgi:hypothetical protein
VREGGRYVGLRLGKTSFVTGFFGKLDFCGESSTEGDISCSEDVRDSVETMDEEALRCACQSDSILCLENTSGHYEGALGIFTKLIRIGPEVHFNDFRGGLHIAPFLGHP